ncbi:MAG: hypothetical protein UY68_C0013G0023 [Parcubacteria group bacterium GW2011_GWF2_52_12]|nr:MAG: hypothetical protein UY68_C0013G0023 [Parcubacteria group bacterium GW2011_GWF2_52_12]
MRRRKKYAQMFEVRTPELKLIECVGERFSRNMRRLCLRHIEWEVVAYRDAVSRQERPLPFRVDKQTGANAPTSDIKHANRRLVLRRL